MNKYLSFLLCIFLILMAVGCTHLPEQQTQKSYKEQKALYDDIISQYTSLLNAKHNGEELVVPNTENMDARQSAISETLYGIVDAYKDAKEVENLGYGYKDFDGNGTPELIILTKYTSIHAIFTLSDDQPILLESNYDFGSSFVFATKNRFFMVRRTVSDNIEEATFYTCRVSGDKMAYDAIYGKVYDQDKKETIEVFRIVDGNRTPIDEDTFRALNREYQKACQPGYSDLSKLAAPRIHFPLVNGVIDSDLPVADFSDYAAIRKTYLAISTCLEKFKSLEWIEGKYDNLFSFPSDRSFEYYTRLLYTAYHSDHHMGYDEVDLNGDGLDELVLMNEDYRIKAIFTQKDGVPVLLDAFAYETCWLDDKGFIHVDNEQYHELEYNLYEFASNGEYKLIYSILAADNGKRYLTENGKTEEITFEKFLELHYEDYCRYSEPFKPYEQTRNVSNLLYTALTEATEDMIKVAADKTWHKYANLEKTTGKDLARSNTYVTFENVTDTQMDMSVKYTFTFSYPDPSRDHYLLDDTTESILRFTVRKEDNCIVFDENGVKGRIEFGQKYLWLVIDESSDQRFSVGNHCFEIYSPQDLIS